MVFTIFGRPSRAEYVIYGDLECSAEQEHGIHDVFEGAAEQRMVCTMLYGDVECILTVSPFRLPTQAEKRMLD